MDTRVDLLAVDYTHWAVRTNSFLPLAGPDPDEWDGTDSDTEAGVLSTVRGGGRPRAIKSCGRSLAGRRWEMNITRHRVSGSSGASTMASNPSLGF